MRPASDRAGTGTPDRVSAPGAGPDPRSAPGGRSAAEERALERLALAFAPLHKRAFGVAVGTAAGLLMALITAYHILFLPPESFRLELLRAYFYGYTVSWPGVVVGAAWGFAVGFVIGWFSAFCRNLAVAISVFITRTRAELGQTRDFLDHI
jgi:hypothetical protein